jgi:hypothetical protein
MEYERGEELHKILMHWLAEYDFQRDSDDIVPMCLLFRKVCKVSADSAAFLQKWFAQQMKKVRAKERCGLTLFICHRLMFPELRVVLVEDSAEAAALMARCAAPRLNRS